MTRRAGLITALALSLLALGCPAEPPPEPPPDDDRPSVPIPELPPAPPEREVAEPGAAAPPAAKEDQEVGLLGQATDPVCGMAIPLSGEPLSATHRDVVYHFCSDTCRAKFLAEPAQWTEDGK